MTYLEVEAMINRRSRVRSQTIVMADQIIDAPGVAVADLATEQAS